MNNKIDIVDVILMILLIASLLAVFALRIDNQNLLEQVDEIDGKYNEVSYQADLINNAYDDLQKEYERLVDYIRTSDKYDLPEGMEEQK